MIINEAERDKTDEVIAKVQFQQGLILILKLVQIFTWNGHTSVGSQN